MAPGSVIGAVGHVADQATVSATINQTEVLRELASLADQMSRYAGQMGLGEQDRAELESRAAELKQELAQASPQPSRIKLLLGAIRSVAENVAGNLIATGILNTIARPEIAAFLKQIHLP